MALDRMSGMKGDGAKSELQSEILTKGANFILSNRNSQRVDVSGPLSEIVRMRREAQSVRGSKQADDVRARSFVDRIIAAGKQMGVEITSDDVETAVQRQLAQPEA